MLKSPGVAMETSRSVFLTCKGRDLMRGEWGRGRGCVGRGKELCIGGGDPSRRRQACGRHDAPNLSSGTPTPAQLERKPSWGGG